MQNVQFLCGYIFENSVSFVSMGLFLHKSEFTWGKFSKSNRNIFQFKVVKALTKS